MARSGGKRTAGPVYYAYYLSAILGWFGYARPADRAAGIRRWRPIGDRFGAESRFCAGGAMGRLARRSQPARSGAWLGTGNLALLGLSQQDGLFMVPDDADRAGQPGCGLAHGVGHDRALLCVLSDECLG